MINQKLFSDILKFILEVNPTEGHYTQVSLQFTGTDSMSTRTGQWATDDGVAAMAVMVPSAVVSGQQAYLLGFAPTDRDTTYGLAVTLGGDNTVRLVVQPPTGQPRVMYAHSLRESLDEPCLVGLRYHGASRSVGLLLASPHVNIDHLVPISAADVTHFGRLLASLELSLMYSMWEDRAEVIDVAMWIGDGFARRWGQAQQAYQTLYGVGGRWV